MIINQLPGATELSQNSKNLTKKIDRDFVGVIDVTHFCNIFFPCIFKEKYKVFETSNYQATNWYIFDIDQTSSTCFSKKFEVKDTDSSRLVGNFRLKDKFPCNLCFGPVLDSDDDQNVNIGYSERPYQLINSGVNIKKQKDSSKDFYTGSNQSCCNYIYDLFCSTFCFCCQCKADGRCCPVIFCICDCFNFVCSECRCNPIVYQTPIWDKSRSLVVGNHYTIYSWLKHNFKICGTYHIVIELPKEETAENKYNIILGSFLYERTLKGGMKRIK